MKYLFSLILLIVCLNMNAQKVFTFSGSHATIDTVTNTGTVTLAMRGVTATYQSACFQIVNTKISGTVAGKTYLQASLDNTNFVSIDSLTNTDKAVNTKLFTVTNPQHAYYRFLWTGTGTMSAKTQGYAHFK